MTNPSHTPEEAADLNALVAAAQRAQLAGRLDEAVAAYRQILAIRPDVAEAHNDLGILLAQQGKFAEAQARLELAVALAPDLVEAHYNLGNVLKDQGKLARAAARYEQALTQRPDHVEALRNLAIILTQQNQLERARARAEQVIALRPNHAEAHNHLGNILWKQGKLDQAAARFEQAIALAPDDAEAHNHLGIVLAEQDQLDQAAASFERALALRPTYAEAHSNLGGICWRQGKLDAAAARFEQAIALAPDFAEAHNSLASALLSQGKLDEAAAHYRRAIAVRPDFADAHLGLATRYLIEGDYERGWPEYEWRLRTPGYVMPRDVPRWTGQPLVGRSLLLVAEQGLGDTLQFIRYARLLKQRGARIVLAAQKALGRLLASGPDWDELFILGSAPQLPRCDYYLPLLSAPGALGTTAATIPRDVPYLAADPELSERWRRELAAIDGLKIAIVWQGARDYTMDRWRSIPLADFAPLACLPGVRLISLQKGPGSEQVATVDFPLVDLSERLDREWGPFMDTAAVIRNVDLVVTANAAIAHLAGALGARVFLALQFLPDWRWLQGRDDSPWYPSMRIFRQTTFGQWHDVFERMAEAVRAGGATGSGG